MVLAVAACFGHGDGVHLLELKDREEAVIR